MKKLHDAPNLLKIDYSPSFKGFSSFLGLFVIAFGGLLFGGISESILFPIFGCVFLSMGLLMLLKLRGVVIDYDQKKMRVYNDYVLFKIGDWELIDHYNQVKIVLEKVTATRQQNRFSSYEVILQSSFNDDEYILKEFSNMKEAQALQVEVAKGLGINCVKEVERAELTRKNRKRKS